jgi:hypothetical protein
MGIRVELVLVRHQPQTPIGIENLFGETGQELFEQSTAIDTHFLLSKPIYSAAMLQAARIQMRGLTDQQTQSWSFPSALDLRDWAAWIHPLPKSFDWR